MAYKLKPVDKTILDLLQNGDLCVPRITKIAHKLQLPTSTVQAKIIRMGREGLIRGFSVVLDPEKLGNGYVVFLLGQAKFGESLDLDQLANKFAKIPQIQEVFFISGEYDYLVKVRVKDQKEYYELVQKIGRILEARATGIVAHKCFKDTQKIKVG